MKYRFVHLPLAVAAAAFSVPATAALEPVTRTYVDIAHAAYEDSLISARALRQAIGAFLDAPSAATLEQARNAWIAARVPYQQTEVYRFGNPIVDEWEGKVNAWPLDEGLIDYVDAAAYGAESEENTFYAANVIANPALTVAGRTIDAGTIDADLLRSLHEVDEVEANVATGYHAIEFLLWGQDLNGTGPGAGDSSGHRLHARRGLHRRPLRAAAGLSHGRHRSADRGSRRDRGRVGAGRRRARDPRCAAGHRADRGDAERNGQPLLR